MMTFTHIEWQNKNQYYLFHFAFTYRINRKSAHAQRNTLHEYVHQNAKAH